MLYDIAAPSAYTLKAVLHILILRGFDETSPAVDINDAVVDLLDADMSDLDTVEYIDEVVGFVLDSL